MTLQDAIEMYENSGGFDCSFPEEAVEPLAILAAAYMKQRAEHASCENDGDLKSGVWFRSACSGLWYRSRMATGSVDAVMVAGQMYDRRERRALPAAVEVRDKVCVECGRQVSALPRLGTCEQCLTSAD
jgi:hypothetical protein